MLRREVIASIVGAAVAWPLGALGQQADRVRRIGLLVGLAENVPAAQAFVTGITAQLTTLGWNDGGNLKIDYQFAPQMAGLLEYAAELVARRPEVLVAFSTPETMALKHQTSTIPIVFVASSDPIASGLVESYARPGGNVTGFTNFEPSMGAKWLQLLKEVAPTVATVGVITSPNAPALAAMFRAIEQAARTIGVDLTTIYNFPVEKLESLIDAFAQRTNAGLVVLPGIASAASSKVIVALAARYRLPAIYSARSYVTTGGLIYYGVNYIESYRGAASYVDRLLRGAQPSELPVQAPTVFALAVNLKTAKALDLTIPPSLLARADEVIE